MAYKEPNHSRHKHSPNPNKTNSSSLDKSKKTSSKKRQQEDWRQNRHLRLIQEHRTQFIAGAAILILFLFVSILVVNLLNSKKEKEQPKIEVGLHKGENGTKYQNPDGTFCKNDWRQVEGDVYYFGKDGLMTTGWLELKGKEYFFDENGKYDSTKHRPMVALTYDDGPGRFTDKLLDCLEENNAKATFFMLGENVEKFPDTVKRMHELGMELGNHSYDHTILSGISEKDVRSQMSKTNNAIEEICGVPADVMRPPGGSYNDMVANAVELPIITWSIDTKDWATRSAENTYDVIMKHAEDGAIVLMHDIHESSIEASLRLIPDLIKNGYRLVTVRQLMEQKNLHLQNGLVYNSAPKQETENEHEGSEVQTD